VTKVASSGGKKEPWRVTRHALRNHQKNGRDVFAVICKHGGLSFMSAIMIEFSLKLWLSY
jgi:hypothetical protein